MSRWHTHSFALFVRSIHVYTAVAAVGGSAPMTRENKACRPENRIRNICAYYYRSNNCNEWRTQNAPDLFPIPLLHPRRQIRLLCCSMDGPVRRGFFFPRENSVKNQIDIMVALFFLDVSFILHT